MFEEWKQAWRQAVENFQREASDTTTGTAPRVRAMEREITSASGALARLRDEIRRVEKEAAKERADEHVCRRREKLAQDAGDDETQRVAAEFAARHAERAAVLERKQHVLQDELGLLARDVDAMKAVVAEAGGSVQPSVGEGSSSAGTPDTASTADAQDFSRLERDARARAADERLEELKRRMRPS